LDRTPSRNFQQLDRLRNWIANVTAWLYSSEPVLHLRIRVQHAAVAQGTRTRRSRSGAATGIAGHKEIEVITVNYAPGAVDVIHRHDAHAVVYVLEGGVEMQVRGGMLQRLGPRAGILRIT
jgi:uncharacterized RmlC-like cupin family protein